MNPTYLSWYHDKCRTVTAKDGLLRRRRQGLLRKRHRRKGRWRRDHRATGEGSHRLTQILGRRICPLYQCWLFYIGFFSLVFFSDNSSLFVWMIDFLLRNTFFLNPHFDTSVICATLSPVTLIDFFYVQYWPSHISWWWWGFEYYHISAALREWTSYEAYSPSMTEWMRSEVCWKESAMTNENKDDIMGTMFIYFQDILKIPCMTR